MKSALTIFTLFFIVVSSSTSFAEWTRFGENLNANTFYLDFEKIRKHDGYVYYWVLVDYLKPTETGVFSGKVYKEGDCGLFRYRFLSFVLHKQPMGTDVGEISNPENPEWEYAQPNTTWEKILNQVCNR
tara:strand:- start:204 stop:590 length:387 start_codon:yes stop_codon:yes gene_type:complete